MTSEDFEDVRHLIRSALVERRQQILSDHHQAEEKVRAIVMEESKVKQFIQEAIDAQFSSRMMSELHVKLMACAQDAIQGAYRAGLTANLEIKLIKNSEGTI